MLSVSNLAAVLRIATVVVPVAIYFLALGLLNSRRHPQLLTGREDFALLIIALSPIFALPILGLVGLSLGSVAATIAVIAAGVLLLAPRGRRWVVYNLPPAEARQAVSRAIRVLGVDFDSEGDNFHLSDTGATVRLSYFPLFRNVCLRVEGGDEKFASAFAHALADVLAAVPAETSPGALALLLTATAMLIAPLALVAHKVPELVRLLTDLLP